GLLVPHRVSRDEVAALLAMVHHSLEQCRIAGLSPDWQLNIAYNGVLHAANAALLAAGYRAPAGEGHHYVVLQSLLFTVGLDATTVQKLDTLRKKRHVATYARAGSVSDREARDALELIDGICADVEAWLRNGDPEPTGG
ncbi:MAG: hypothetical protein NTX23_07410, partial [Candidatus Bipolaricaulota bacterium]|nr:hypothetical protein [Candidatus Bipolaricaulota bacterium]